MNFSRAIVARSRANNLQNLMDDPRKETLWSGLGQLGWWSGKRDADVGTSSRASQVWRIECRAHCERLSHAQIQKKKGIDHPDFSLIMTNVRLS
jgi:hypothetical protein